MTDPIQVTLDADGRTILTDLFPSDAARLALQFVSASFSGNAEIQGRIAGVTSDDWHALEYIDMADGTSKTAKITGDALVLAEGSGLEVAVNVDTYASGSMIVYARPVVGR